MANINVSVADGTTGEPLEFAVVTFCRPGIKGNVGSSTDRAGIYSAQLLPGTWTLKVNTVGYKADECTVAVVANMLITVKMRRSEALREVGVTAREARNASSA